MTNRNSRIPRLDELRKLYPRQWATREARRNGGTT